MFHKFLLKKKIARRFIDLGVPVKEACRFANKINGSQSVLIIRNSETYKPDLIIFIKTK